MRKLLKMKAVAVLLLLVLGATSRNGWSQDARLTDVVVTNTKEALLVYFTVTECFNQEMQQAIDNGILTRFTFFVKLYQVRRFWWDREIADLKVSHDIQYDNLKGIYRVYLREKSDKPLEVEDFQEAKRLMADIVALRVTGLENLQRGVRYRLKMMAELDKIRLPFHLHYVLFFLSLWDFETDWYTVDFRY